jgi:GMP synthase (glutamine-hydrolysing)
MDVTHAMMCRWTTRGHERMAMPGAQQRAAHFEGRLLHDAACRSWLDSFLDHWLRPQPAAKRSRAQRRGASRVSTR